MKTITGSLRQNLIAGILVTVPFGLTIFILFKLGKWIVDLVSAAPARFIHPLHSLPDSLFQTTTFLIGLMATILIVLIVGAVTRNYLGSKLLNFGETVISKIPLARTIYTASKQIIETVFVGSKMKNLKRVVLFEYPRKGIFSIGFVTGSLKKGEFHNVSEHHLISVFIPTAPNPTSGYYIMIPEEDIIELSLSVEDAFRIILSAGLSANSSEDEDDSRKN